MPFYEIANKGPAEHEIKSTYTTSSYSDDYKVTPYIHVGSTNKLLEPYSTKAFRSRLPEPDAPILTKNAS